MKIAAYQFEVTGNIESNVAAISEGISQAVASGVQFLILPECALTGYPPRDIVSSDQVDFSFVARALASFQQTADLHDICILVGTIEKEGDKYYNRAVLLKPNSEMQWYDKRALYGWDSDNFACGEKDGIFKIGDLSVGVRICFEVRFPEYYRELYRAKTDLDVTIFYDVSDRDDEGRYQMIKSHLITRAVENVTPCFSVDAVRPFQTAPTCLIDASGRVPAELPRNDRGLLVYDLKTREPDFGELGRIKYSDLLLGME